MLVLDRLSALMLLLTALLALPRWSSRLARWDRAGQHFHSLFQFLLMGLNGAFLTGDLFNLFVFFEVLLAASYGLALHGSGPLRVRAGLHYIAINLAASLLFLIGVSLIYGVTGTLNMADLAARVPLVAGGRPAAARGRRGGPRRRLPGQGGDVAALLLAADHLHGRGAAGRRDVRGAEQGRRLRRAAAVLARLRRRRGADDRARRRAAGRRRPRRRWSSARSACSPRRGSAGSPAAAVLVSSGTLLAVDRHAGLGGGSPLVAAALFYLVASTLGLSALFLMVELIEREQGAHRRRC